MRLLPWSRSRDSATAQSTNGHTADAEIANKAMTAGGERKQIGDRTEAERMRKHRQQDWQRDAWAYFDAVPEVKAAMRYRAASISKIRLTAAFVRAPGEMPIPLDAMETVTENGVTTERYIAAEVPDNVRAIALDTVARLDQSPGGVAGILSELTFNLDAPGDCWLVGFGEREVRAEAGRIIPAVEETWEIKSLDEVDTSSGYYRVKGAPKGIKDGLLTEDDFITRLWQSHPKNSDLADSPLHGVLDTCEELMILGRAARAWALSRLNAGILGVSNDLLSGLTDPTNPNEDKYDKVKSMLTTAVVTPIQDEGSAAAVVPIFFFGETDAIDRGLKHITFDRAIDDKLDERMELRVQRLSRGLDAPVERVVGHQSTTFANAAQVTIDEFRGYLEPTVMQECAMLTTGFFRPLVEAAGVERSLLRRLVVWYDASELVAEPDRRPTANEAHERLTISDATYRREVGYSEDDAPSETEVLQRIGAKRGALDPAMTEVLLRLLLPTLPEPERQPAAIPASAVRTALTAATGGNIGRRLMAIDRSLRARLEALADHHVRRALETAGARVRSKAVTSAALRPTVTGLRAIDVPRELGQSVVAALGITDDELLEGSFDDLHDEFDQRVRRAQAATLAVLESNIDLSEAELEDIERQQERDRSDAWGWFLGALVALAQARLYDPAPEAQPGEFDGLATVPPGLVREVVARAGGASGLENTGGALTTVAGTQPAGGVGTGGLAQRVFAEHGTVLAGWEWVYGDPSSRGSNFEPHLALDGTIITDWNDPALSVGENTWLATPTYRPGDHPYCFPAGTVVSGPSPRGATLRWYEGDLIELAFASGQFLSATPNHPVLTRRGWVPAGALVEGDEVLRCEGAERVAGLVPHDRQVPALIEEVVAAVGVAPEMIARRVPVSPEHFHGDGRGSEIAVVWTDSELRNGVETPVGEPSSEDSFSFGDADASQLSGERSLTPGLESVGDAPLGGMGSLGVGEPLLRGESGHAETGGLAGIATGDSSSVQALVDGATGYAEALGQSEDRLATLVEFDKVISVDSHAFAGDVHNLQTATGWYLANGIVVHNCQCDFVPVYADAGTVD